MSAAPVVVFDDVSFAFDEQVVLEHVSFSVPKGRAVSHPTDWPLSFDASRRIRGSHRNTP